MATGYLALIHSLRSILVMIALYGWNLASSSFFRQILMDHHDYRAGNERLVSQRKFAQVSCSLWPNPDYCAKMIPVQQSLMES
jgi:hypothetical protein